MKAITIANALLISFIACFQAQAASSISCELNPNPSYINEYNSSHTSVTDTWKCGDQSLTNSNVHARCGFIGASFDQNVGVNDPPPSDHYGAALGYILAQQRTQTKIRWYNHALSGVFSSDWSRQLDSIIAELTNPSVNDGVQLTKEHLNCLVIGPTAEMWLGSATDIYNNLANLVGRVASSNGYRQDLKIFVTDYPPVSKIQDRIGNTAKATYTSNLSTISALINSNLSNKVGIVNTWGTTSFATRDGVHPNLITVCNAAQLITDGIYYAFTQSTFGQIPSNTSMCQYTGSNHLHSEPTDSTIFYYYGI